MAQDITWLDNQYENVPFVELPKTGGGNALFTDVSPTTAVDADVASGKIYFKADGSQSTGTGSGGGVDVESLSVTSNGTYTAPTGKAYSPVVVNVSGGGGSAERKDVNFYDYDGSIVASYTTAEFANIDALPSNPSHTGLTAQGWNMPSNWTLANAKTYVATNGKADWGQMYTTASGKTEIDVEFTDPNRLSPTMSLAVNGTVSVDWGDGSAATTVTGTSLKTRLSAGPHTYPAVGKYMIKVTATSGSSYGFWGTNKYFLLNKNSNTASVNRVYANSVKAVRIGAGCTSIGQYSFYYCASLTGLTIPNTVTNIGNNAFQYCYSLTSITIPDGVTSIENSAFSTCYSLTNIMIPNSVTNIGLYAFSYCYSLASITIPNSVTSVGISAFDNCNSLANITILNSVTSIGSNAFDNCNSLASITIPNSVTNIGQYAFSGCSSLASITIPNDVTSIGSSVFATCYALTCITIPSGVTSIATKAFQNCYGLGSIHFKGSTPPSVAASDAFSNLPTDCKIYVPTGKLSAYTSASNYPSSSTYTYIEE